MRNHLLAAAAVLSLASPGLAFAVDPPASAPADTAAAPTKPRPDKAAHAKADKKTPDATRATPADDSATPAADTSSAPSSSTSSAPTDTSKAKPADEENKAPESAPK